MRKTQARQAIVELLAKAHKPVTAREIVDGIAKSRPDINKSTVYRFIKSLIDTNQLVAIPLVGKGALYELRTDALHHHFACEKCQDVVCLDGADVQLRRMVPQGFSVSPQHVVLSGLCAKCS